MAQRAKPSGAWTPKDKQNVISGLKAEAEFSSFDHLALAIALKLCINTGQFDPQEGLTDELRNCIRKRLPEVLEKVKKPQRGPER